MRVNKLLVGVVIGSALFAFGLLVAVAFDVAWAKFIGYLVSCALHASAGVLVAGALLPPRTSTRGRIVIRVLSGIGALALGWVLFKIGAYVSGLPIDGRWKAVYFVVTVSSFWIAIVVGIGVLSPRFDTAAFDRVAIAVMTGVATFGLTTVAVVVTLGLITRSRQNDVDRDPIAIPAITTVDGGTYLALGDSYSAGEGLGPFEEGTAKRTDGKLSCHRSDRAYPHLLTFDSADRVDLTFNACSGAITADIDLPIAGKRDLPAQIEGVDAADVSLVTMTIGGNDEAFSRVVQNCFFFEDCIEAYFEPPTQPAGRRRVIFPGKEPLDLWATDALQLLQTNLDRVYAELRSTFPEARIVVIGYPYLFPSGGAPLWQKDCGIVLRRVDEQERDTLREMTDTLNREIFQRAVRAGLEYVSTTEAWVDHEPCGKKGQYTNAIKPFGESILDGGSFHPNSQGQRLIARLVACYLNATPDRPAAQPSPPSTVPVSPTCPG